MSPTSMGNYPKRRTFVAKEDRTPRPLCRRLRPATHVFRSAASHVRSAVERERRDPETVAKALFGQDEPTFLLLRAASTQATTATTGWAAEIAQHAIRDMIISITS